MSFEIERKFLISTDAWQSLVTSSTPIRQAYLASDAKTSIRIRIKDNASATLTIKSRPTAVRRLELEYKIPVLEAEALMALRTGGVVEKVRHVVPWHDLAWEIDVFSGDNAGLIIAEIELHHEEQHFELPNWIGQEVTGQSQYYNSSLVQQPFREWSTPPSIAAVCGKN
jgi:adenylate cyclase